MTQLNIPKQLELNNRIPERYIKCPGRCGLTILKMERMCPSCYLKECEKK